MPNRYDVSLDGTEYRLIRGEGSYKQGASRSMVDFQEIETMEGTQLSSRNDVRTLYQTSWAGGSRWEKPLISAASIDSYYTSDDFDMMVEPGSLLPRENTSSSSTTLVENHSKWVQTSPTVAYAVGKDGGTYHGVIKWTDGIVSAVTEHSNIANAEEVIDACWSEDDSSLFMLSSTHITYCKPGTSQGNVLAATPGRGASLFMHLGSLYYWGGKTLQKVSDPLGSPSFSTIFDDGYPMDWLDSVSSSPSTRWHFPWSSNLAISTSDGVYLVKNVAQSGTVVAYIYRIDRDAAGTNIGTPVATLDPGYAALDIYWSLGSLLVSATSDIGLLGTNDTSKGAPRTEFFHLTQNSLGAIGAPTGNEPSEFVFKMLLTSQRTVYIGGGKNVWAYDPIRGGIHMLHENTSLTSGHYHSGLLGSTGVYLFHGSQASGQATVKLPYSDNIATTADRIVESNYFDFSLPGELKYISEVIIMPTAIQSGETWTISIEADDGSWSTAASFTTGSTQSKTLATPISGYRFRYKITYASTGAQSSPSKLKGIVFRALSGEMVPYWQLMIDGTEARNVENGIVRPEDVFTHLKTLRADKTPVTFIDHYESDDRSSSTTYTVRVQSVTIVKEEPKEAQIQVVLAGV